MNALLIHADGRAEVVFGSFDGDLTKVAVLTQAAVSALEEDGPCQGLQCRHADHWITLLKRGQDAWLRVQHEPDVSLENIEAWVESLPPPQPQVRPAPRIQSIADALNVAMP
ncbi:MAG: hypothetical protein CJBNEKGG_00596 [Prosthecobacter sp.]|nr:hypothetical protein [Prosthecobacter sp.]